MNFTLFLNSRGRVKQLERFVGICEQKTRHHSEVEMYITGDYDDAPTVRFLNSLQDRKTFTFNPIVGPRPTSLCASFNNMAHQAKGRYLLVLNDDAEIVTTDWDVIALKKITEFQEKNKFKDDIVYGLTTDISVDKTPGRKYAAFPIISAQAIQVLGFFMYEQFVGLGGDSSIYRIYEAAGRVVDMTEITIDHIYHNSLIKVLTPDKTAAEMRANSAKFRLDPFTFDVSVDTTRLLRFIRDKNP